LYDFGLFWASAVSTDTSLPPKPALTLFDVLSYSSSRWWRGKRGENAALTSGAENQIPINPGMMEAEASKSQT
jgi:hypothetical protein